MRRWHRYVIEFEPPPGATDHQLRRYIIDELKSAGGQYHPDDPMHKGLDVTVVRVRDQAGKP